MEEMGPFSPTGEWAASREVGTSVLAMLSRRLEDRVVGLVRAPGVGNGLPPLGVPFSLVTSPLSWTYLEDREWEGL